MSDGAQGMGPGGPGGPGVSGVGEKYGFPSPYDLDDEMVKLVAYTIVSIQRDRERVMKGGAGTVVVTERMTPESFAAWRISEYLASNAYAGLDEEEKLGPSERKHLRVDYVVSRRWPLQSRGFERRQLAILGGIREALDDGGDPGGETPNPSPTTASGQGSSGG